MPKHLLPVPHVRQCESADCLAACTAMVLAYLGIKISYTRLVQVLDIGAIRHAGAKPAPPDCSGSADQLRSKLVHRTD